LRRALQPGVAPVVARGVRLCARSSAVIESARSQRPRPHLSSR